MKSKLIILLPLIPVIIFTAFLLNDLEISKSLYNPQNEFAIFIEHYGELPGVFLLVITATIWGFNNKSPELKNRLPVIIFSPLIAVSLLLYSVYVIFFYGNNPVTIFYTNQLIIIFMVIVLILVFILSELKFDLKSTNKILIFTKITLLTWLIGYGLIIQPLKTFWGRVRFRDLDALYANFTLWYLPNGFTGNDSFPSGHAAMGFMLLPLIILFWNKRPVFKSLIVSLILMWGILVCLGRIVIGAHFATDVLIGGSIIIIAFIISLLIFNKELTGLKNK